MNITDIEIYCDGGSIEFFVERGSEKKRVWLETPFAGEPRALLIDSKKVNKGAVEIDVLCADIAEWWAGLGEDVQRLAVDGLSKDETILSLNETTRKALSLRRVRFVQDYITEHYT